MGWLGVIILIPPVPAKADLSSTTMQNPCILSTGWGYKALKMLGMRFWKEEDGFGEVTKRWKVQFNFGQGEE
jgi:hypothetical protein